jgi:hypothetical protein
MPGLVRVLSIAEEAVRLPISGRPMRRCHSLNRSEPPGCGYPAVRTCNPHPRTLPGSSHHHQPPGCFRRRGGRGRSRPLAMWGSVSPGIGCAWRPGCMSWSSAPSVAAACSNHPGQSRPAAGSAVREIPRHAPCRTHRPELLSSGSCSAQEHRLTTRPALPAPTSHRADRSMIFGPP